MNSSITITQAEFDNQENHKIMISGAVNHDEARQAADEWCDKHNSRVLDFIHENPSAGAPDAGQVYYAIFGSDDYQ